MKYTKMTEIARSAALSYILRKLDSGVEMFALESSSKEEVLFINSLEFALFVETASLDKLDKLMRVSACGVELRAVKYEAVRTVEAKAFVSKGTLASKAKRSAGWQIGEQQIADMLNGVRTGGDHDHLADVTVIRHGRTLLVEVKNSEGRLY